MNMAIKWHKLNRKVHYWGAVICALPILIVIGSGTLLLLKKEFEWIQPATARTSSTPSVLRFDQILEQVKLVKEAEITTWGDVSRLDVRPTKGIIKVQAKNQWEIQLDFSSGTVLKTAYRRSDFIESIHDGTYFHELAKLGLFLPAALILFILWVTGIYLFLLPYLRKNKAKKAAST